MRLRGMAVIAAGLVFQAGLTAAPARAEEKGGGLSGLLLGIARSLEAEQHDTEIKAVFKDEFDRTPSDSEMRRYRSLMEEDHWTRDDIRNDVRGRSDYRRHSRSPYEDPERVIRRAYQDILHRDPDPEGMRTYRSLMIDKDWSESDVREALRKSTEKDELRDEHRRQEAEKIVRRAYQDVLGRDPDSNGLYTFRNKVLDDGWDEHDVREALKRSPENRQKNQITRQDAETIVRRAYRAVLGRDPDSAGLATFSARVLNDKWGEQDVARALRNSDEYRNRHR